MPLDPSEISVRDATEDDLRAIIDLLASDDLGKARERVEDVPARCYVSAFHAITQDANNRLLVVEKQGHEGPVGTLQLTFIPGLSHQGTTRAQIEAVRIDDAHQGLGIGELVFKWAIKEATLKGCRVMQLTTDLRRADAKRFYERLGFSHSHAGMKMRLEITDNG